MTKMLSSLESPHPQFLCYYHEFVLNFCLETEKPSRKKRKRKRKRKTHNTNLGFSCEKNRNSRYKVFLRVKGRRSGCKCVFSFSFSFSFYIPKTKEAATILLDANYCYLAFVNGMFTLFHNKFLK